MKRQCRHDQEGQTGSGQKMTFEKHNKLIENCKQTGLNARNAKSRVHRYALKRLPPNRENAGEKTQAQTPLQVV